MRLCLMSPSTISVQYERDDRLPLRQAGLGHINVICSSSCEVYAGLTHLNNLNRHGAQSMAVAQRSDAVRPHENHARMLAAAGLGHA